MDLSGSGTTTPTIGAGLSPSGLGFLRLHAMPADDCVSARNTLTLTLQDPALNAVALLDVRGMADNQRAGLGMFFKQPHWIGIVESGGRRHLALYVNGVETPGPPLAGNQVQLRVHIEKETAGYSYSLDEGKTFVTFGERLPIAFSWWKGARVCFFSFTKGAAASDMGFADIDWLHYEAAREVE